MHAACQCVGTPRTASYCKIKTSIIPLGDEERFQDLTSTPFPLSGTHFHSLVSLAETAWEPGFRGFIWHHAASNAPLRPAHPHQLGLANTPLPRNSGKFSLTLPYPVA